MTALRVIGNEDEAELSWNDLFALQADKSPFCEYDFMESLAELFGWSCISVASEDVLMARLFLRTRGPLRDVIVPPLMQFTSILLHPDADEAQVRQGLQSLHGGRDQMPGTSPLPFSSQMPYSRLFSFSPILSEYLKQAPSGYKSLEKHTYVLPSGSVEDSITGWSSSTRRNFRKSEADYVFVKDSVAPVEIAELTSHAYAAAGRRFPLPPAVIGEFASALVQRSMARTVGVVSKSSGELEAGVVLLENRQTSWYWLAGSQPGPAMTVLMAHLQADLAEKGISNLDLVGANTPSIAEFKRRFGGTLVGYTHHNRQAPLNRLAAGIAGSIKG